MVDPIQSVKGKVVIDAFRCIRCARCCWLGGGGAGGWLLIADSLRDGCCTSWASGACCWVEPVAASQLGR